LDHWNGDTTQVRIFQNLGLTYPLCLNALNTKNTYTEPGFYNDFSILIDQTGIVRYKGAGVNVSEITNWIANLLLTNIDEQSERIPNDLVLYQNYPNPFNPITTIKFNLQQNQQVKLNIYDISGKLIRKLIDNELYAGLHEIMWEGKDSMGNNAPSGIYIYSLKAGTNKIIKKMTLLR
jgi:hypothetical protein